MLKNMFLTAAVLAGMVLAYNYGENNGLQSSNNDPIQVEQVGDKTYLHWTTMDKTYDIRQFGNELYMGSRDHQITGATLLVGESFGNNFPMRTPVAAQGKNESLKDKLTDEFYNAVDKAKDLKKELWGN